MTSHQQDSVAADLSSAVGTTGDRSRRANAFRYVVRRRGLLAALLIVGFVVGVAYRVLFDPSNEQDPGDYLRSGLHGIGIALVASMVQAAFALTARSPFGAALRRLPVAGEIVIRSLAMTAALVVAGIALQFVLYAEPLGLHWFTAGWFTATLPAIIAIGFAISLVAGAITETGRLIGRPLLASVLLGTYHRPAREQRIVMFLDIAGSTRLAEQMGELRVHDLITRFFFDIDEPINDHGGAVHAYVGDEVIVTWPVSGEPSRDARCLTCFFAIERKMAGLAMEYRREFDVVPHFRAGLHVGPVIVSECGNTKRQLAYFGDTMNVAARLCDYCKTSGQRLIASGDLLRQLTIPADLRIGNGENLVLRGREEPIAGFAISMP